MNGPEKGNRERLKIEREISVQKFDIPAPALQILEDFKKYHPKLWEDMENSNHNWSDTILNPFHNEGPVSVHTQMVMEQLKHLDNPAREVMLATLLHDVGKPLAEERIEDTQRVRFIGHEGIGAYMVADILKGPMGEGLSRQEKIDIILMVALHGTLYSKDKARRNPHKNRFRGRKELLEKLGQLTFCDTRGRIYTTGAADVDFAAMARAIEVLNEPELDQNAPTLTLMMGPPGCGKSTARKGYKGAIICRDDIIEETVDGTDYNDKYAKANHNTINRELNRRLNEAIKNGENILIDMMLLSAKSRRSFLNNSLFKKAHYNTEAIVVVPGLEETLARNKTRENDGKDLSAIVVNRLRTFMPPLGEVDRTHFLLDGERVDWDNPHERIIFDKN